MSASASIRTSLWFNLSPEGPTDTRADAAGQQVVPAGDLVCRRSAAARGHGVPRSRGAGFRPDHARQSAMVCGRDAASGARSGQSPHAPRPTGSQGSRWRRSARSRRFHAGAVFDADPGRPRAGPHRRSAAGAAEGTRNRASTWSRSIRPASSVASARATTTASISARRPAAPTRR